MFATNACPEVGIGEKVHVKEMAAANLTHRFETKLKTQNSAINMLQRMIGLGFTVLAVLITGLSTLLSGMEQVSPLSV